MSKAANEMNKQPIIGVLCIDVSQRLREIYGTQVKSYIAASYVKWLEGAGGRVIPIWIGQSREYYENIMKKINGVLIPGGAVFFNEDQTNSQSEWRNDCVQSSKYIYEIAEEQNKSGKYFSIWGTCLGMELLLLHSAEGKNPRKGCAPMDCGLPVEFVEGFRKSKLFSNLSDQLENIMRVKAFGYHFHRYCIKEDDLMETQIKKDWLVLAYNQDDQGLEFISILEHKIYPFYGIQFHPERVQYEQIGGTDDHCSHDLDSIRATQYFAEFFVNECRRSENHFACTEDELVHSIWNFEVTFCGRHNAHWAQCYLFKENPQYLQ